MGQRCPPSKKLKLRLCLLRPQLISGKSIGFFFVFSEHVVNRICRRRVHQTCGYRNDSQEGMILTEYLSSTTACIMYEGLSFSVDEILELSEGREKEVWALHLQPII